MASSLALRRSASLFRNLLNSHARATPVASRFFNTNAQMTTFDDDDRRDVDVDRRSDRSVNRRGDSFFPDFFDPFAPTRSLSQMLNFMDQIADRGLGPVTTHRGWDVKEDNEALKLRMDMPGIDKEKVKISVEQNVLIIKGEEDEAEGEEGRRYSSRIELPQNVYKVDEIKAEMKNGVLKVRVPKVKEEERKDVFQVKIE
ncbi:23.5 kDa heat shock protein, mitochondrial-like [Apium graveolens]|uniref:23.5 kDa heat shock protein, mitochondrial-like n=1 Tax=Apium graveolens TaxID=4045 RepID=UPI003D7A7DFD